VTITVRLDPELESRLSAQARAAGISLDAYLHTVIEQAAAVDSRPEVSQDEFEAGLRTLAEGSERLPILPPEAYRRESIYGDD